MSDDREPDWPGPPDDGGRPDPAAIDAQLPAVEAHCRAVTGREDEAVRAAGVVIESARSLLTDPERLRAWLLANARRELLGDAAPTAQDAFDLVHRHGIQPEDLPVVLGMPPTEADELLAAAEEELGWGTNWSDTAYANEGNPDLPAVGSSGGMFDTQLLAVVAYCRAVTGREDDAVSAAGVVIESARSLLTDPERLRAWLLANARRELLGDAAPTAQDAFDLVHRHGIQPEDLPVVLGMPPTEADELLAAAEEELGWGTNWSDTAYANESNPDLPAVGSSGGMFDTQLPAVVAYCRAVTGREDDAVTAAAVVIESARSLLTDPQRLHAWLLANARRELLGDAAPTAQEASDLVRRHGIQPEDLPVVLAMPPTEADELLAAAEEEYAGNAIDSGEGAAGPSPSDGLDEHRSWDDRAAAWSDIAAIGDDAGSDAGSGDDSEWDEVFGPKSHRLQDIYGLFRKQPEAAARHAAPRISADLREVLANGRHVQAAAAAGIVVAVIGGLGGVYLASSHSPPSQAAHQTKDSPSALA